VIVAISVETDGKTFDAADDDSHWSTSAIGLRAEIASGDPGGSSPRPSEDRLEGRFASTKSDRL
jgi:hypothetical protein